MSSRTLRSARLLFRRVTRYPVASSLDPRENRLTEVTAAMLERVEGVAQTFVRHLLDASEEDAQRRALDPGEAARRAELRRLAPGLVPKRVEVNTQVATTQGRFVDLEVLLRPKIGASESGLLVWVEAKYGADLHGDQLDAYLHDIRIRPVVDE